MRLRSRSFRAALAFLVAGWVLVPAGNGSAAAPTLPMLQQEGARRNERLRAAYEQWQAVREQARVEGALPDPRLTFGAFLRPIETRLGPQEQQVGLTQMIPWFGSRGHRRAAASSEATAARARLDDTWHELSLRIAEAYHEVHRIDRSVAIARDDLALLEAFEPIARTRLRVGMSDTTDLLRLQVEMGRAADRVRQLQQRRPTAVARLNALLARAEDAALDEIAELDEPAAMAPLDTLVARLERDQPRLRALAGEAEREQEMTEVARDSGRPDLMLGLVYTFVGERDDVDMRDEGRDALLATFSVNVPLWRGAVDARVQGAQRRRAAALATSRDERHRLVASLRTAAFEFDDADRRVALYRDTLLPKADETLQATLANYQNGRARFLDLLDAERVLLEFRLALLDARVARADARARVERIVGAGSLDLSVFDAEEAGR